MNVIAEGRNFVVVEKVSLLSRRLTQLEINIRPHRFHWIMFHVERGHSLESAFAEVTDYEKWFLLTGTTAAERLECGGF